MLQEALSAPAAVAHQLAHDQNAYAELGEALREQPPTALLTVARGSSDHAAHYMAYLMMARMGRLVTSLPMSLVTLYQSKIVCDGLVSLAFSQSGQSPDLVAPTKFFREGGARTVAFVNAESSPLADAAQFVFPLRSGPELSVAATKSYIAQLVAGARVVAAWSGDEDLQAALQQLPSALEEAAKQRWDVAVDVLKGADKLFVIGRGTGLPIAMEAALKFKETCGIQAEAFSGAEVKHGPMALVDEGYPMLVFAPRGPAQAGLIALAEEMRGRGARVLLAAPAGTPGAELPLACTGNEDLDPIAVVQSFYPMVEALARARGRNPDAPPHLAKVTKTN
ncbi:iron dicitrate transport regulator FecR [Paucibacter aquatile]|uniref:Iron dicitrate transport regulator FecR n=1 Tax=Kinneretia aquatilis TaxID=2070761 RepID=A0A2N8L2D9_9BURK|nr:SIS domain-containing protein [Paucibacter aquatile]PND39847.1 iron dicitrate transport regulator FecR [Paucibacter aquatile]WIW00130.1 SIS domain-containing protein [Paucibacter aquatile]